MPWNKPIFPSQDEHPILGYFGQLSNYLAVSKSSNNDAYKLFLGLLRQLRRENGVTQVALAELLGKPQSYVSKYELGERRIDVVEAIEICRALDADFVALVQRFLKKIGRTGGESIASQGKSRHSRSSDNA